MTDELEALRMFQGFMELAEKTRDAFTLAGYRHKVWGCPEYPDPILRIFYRTNETSEKMERRQRIVKT